MKGKIFNKGQRVVAIETVSNQYGIGIVKDEIYTIHDELVCPICNYQMVDVGLGPVIAKRSHCECRREMPVNKVWIYNEAFAPLNPPRVSAIPELLKAPVEETLDVHPVKILTDG